MRQLAVYRHTPAAAYDFLPTRPPTFSLLTLYPHAGTLLNPICSMSKVLYYFSQLTRWSSVILVFSWLCRRHFCLISAWTLSSCWEELPYTLLSPSGVGNEPLLKVWFCKQTASAEQGEQCGTLHSLNSSWARSWPSPTHFKCIPDNCFKITSALLGTTVLWPIWRSALTIIMILNWYTDEFLEAITSSHPLSLTKILLQMYNVCNFVVFTSMPSM